MTKKQGELSAVEKAAARIIREFCDGCSSRPDCDGYNACVVGRFAERAIHMPLLRRAVIAARKARAKKGKKS